MQPARFGQARGDGRRSILETPVELARSGCETEGAPTASLRKARKPPSNTDGRAAGNESAPRAGVLEGAGEADQSFATHLLTQPGIAGREGHQVGIEAQALQDLPSLKKTVF